MNKTTLAILDCPGSPQSSIGSELMFLETPEGAKKVLEEDEYLNRMSNIIKRDFFPHHDPHNWNLNSEYNDDCAHLDTPGSQISTTSSVRSRNASCKLGLNDFLSRYTSEDNAHFERIVRRAQRRNQRKYPCSQNKIKAHNIEVKDQLNLPQIEKQAKLSSDSMQKIMIDWPHNPKNSLFHPPKDSFSTQYPKPTINYQSSKFVYERLFKKPITPTSRNETSFKRLSHDKIGVDGKLLSQNSETPAIGGYLFVPAPGTPTKEEFKVGSCSYHDINKSKYYLPSQSPRDELAHGLYEERVGKFIRTPKLSRQSDSTMTPSASRFRSTPRASRLSHRDTPLKLIFSPDRVKIKPKNA